MKEKFINNKQITKNLIELNQGRYPGEKYIDENGEINSLGYIVYINENELSVIFKNNILKNYKSNGIIIEIPVIFNLFDFRKNKKGLIRSIIEELSKNVTKEEWKKINYIKSILEKDDTFKFIYVNKSNVNFGFERNLIRNKAKWELTIDTRLEFSNASGASIDITCLFEKLNLETFKKVINEILKKLDKFEYIANFDKQLAFLKSNIEPILKEYC